jgi:uncharacterized protein (DUF1778 family)
MSPAISERRPPARSRERDKSSANIHIRVPQQTKQLIDTAASAVGKSLSEFVLDSARKHAIDVLLDQRLFILDADKYDAFLSALDNPPPASKALKALMRRQPLWQK